MNYSLDIEAFIQEVEKYPDIWDINSEGHRYKTRKLAAWGNVARVFITDFDDLGQQEKSQVYTKLFSKWRNIRDQYVRHRKNRLGKKGYLYAQYLRFLDSIYKGGDCSSDEDQDSNETQECNDGEQKLKRIGFVTTGPKDNPHLEVVQDRWVTEDTPLASIASRSFDKGKRKRESSINLEYVETPLLPDASCSYPVEDEDKSFFDSLLPAVRDLDIDDKLEFRSDVLRLLRAVRSRKKRIKPDPDENIVFSI